MAPRDSAPAEVQHGLEPDQGLMWFGLQREGRSSFGHDGGDSGVATACFFDPDADVGVVARANGN